MKDRPTAFLKNRTSFNEEQVHCSENTTLHDTFVLTCQQKKPPATLYLYHISLSYLGGLVVRVFAIGTKVCGFKPGRRR
jgi:hypothetical protein